MTRIMIILLHDSHNDYPLAPEKIVVQEEWLSPYCKFIKNIYNITSDTTTKLIPTLNNKQKYVIHIKNLKLYYDLGMKITKVHRVLQFNESKWLELYITFNTKKGQSQNPNLKKQ